jgi:hypothetical protein
MAVDHVSMSGDAPILDADLPRGDRVRPARSFLQVLGEGARAPPPTPPPVSTPPLPRPEPGQLRTLAVRALDAERAIDRVLAAAAGGRTFSSAELLALQVQVFRYSQAVEIVSRGTDRLVGALKQAMGTQT